MDGQRVDRATFPGHRGGIWPAIVATTAGVDLLNHGPGGSALLDPLVACIIGNQPAHLISLKRGINIVNMDLMRLLTFEPAMHGFRDTIRDGHPKTPRHLTRHE